jgi:DNA processing protein
VHEGTEERVDERHARVALNLLTEPGDPRVARLVAALGAQEVHARLLDDTDLDGVRSDVAARLAGLDPSGILAEAARMGVRFVVPGDPEWPDALDDLADVEPVQGMSGAPLGLWLRGPARLSEVCDRAVAVVGSRSATSYGAAVASDLAAHLSSADVSVVSGAAFGVDQAAHRGALAVRGRTVAVLACGVDRAYPAAHRDLLELLADEGLVVSELPPGSAPTRVRFLGRNRLIAALTQGTVVVEAAVRSGALNTAGWALRLNRIVMGVPGPVTSAASEGVHELLRLRGGQLVTRGSDVLELVSPAGSCLAPVRRAAPSPRDGLSPDQRVVLESVPLVRGAPPSSIARAAGLAEATVRAVLAELDRGGFVESRAGCWRQRPTSEPRRRLA